MSGVLQCGRIPVTAGFERHSGREDAMPGPCLFEIVLRQSIATQHALACTDRLKLRTCEGCGKPYLLATVWLPHTEEGSIACPRCGAEAVAWDGARGFMAYWQRDADLPSRVGVSRQPAARSSRAAPLRAA